MEYFLLFPLMKKTKIDQEMRELYSKINWHLFSGHSVQLQIDSYSINLYNL